MANGWVPLRQKTLAWRSGAAALALIAATGSVRGQDGPPDGGAVLTFGFASELRYDDNYDLDVDSRGGTTLLDTTLHFGLRSQTSTQLIELDIGALLRALDGPDGSDTEVRPELHFRYEREGARSRLSIAANYEELDLGLLETYTDPLNGGGGGTVVTTTGRRATADVTLRFETGIDTPLGTFVELSHVDRRIVDGPSEGENTRTDSVNAGVRLKFSPVLTGGLTLDASRESVNDVDRTRRHDESLSASLDYEVDPATRLGISLGTARRTTETTAGETRRSGPIATVTLDHDLPDGAIGLRYARELTSDGDRDTLAASRRFELPLGELAFELGVTRVDGGDLATIGQVDYRHEFKRGTAALGLSRGVETDEDDNPVISTRLTADYTQDLTALTSMQLGLSYARIEDPLATGDAEEATLSLTVQRQLTADWGLDFGVEHRMSRDAGADAAHSNAIFVGIGRDFSVGR